MQMLDHEISKKRRRMKKGYPIQIGKQTWKELEQVRNHGYSYFFNDWLDIILNSLLALTENHLDALAKQDLNEISKGKYNERYMEIIKKYSEGKPGERAIDHLTRAFTFLLQETQETQRDVLGEIFQAQITYGEHGQFFTPEHVTDFMSQILISEQATDKDPETVMDPCCGSGRFLLGSAKNNPNNYLIGQDIDERCCKMAAINLFIFNLNGEIRLGNSLANKIEKRWIVRKGGFIYLDEDGRSIQQDTEN